MAITRLRPHKRVAIGRNITLISAMIYALSRSMIYLTLDPSTVTGVAAFLTANGGMLWAWSLAWFAAAVFCLTDMRNHHTRYGLSLVVGLAAAWGLAHGIHWAIEGFADMGWLTAVGWLTPAAIVFGFLIKVTALHDMLNPDGAGEKRVASE